MALLPLSAINFEHFRAVIAAWDAAAFKAVNTGLASIWLDPLMVGITWFGAGVTQAGINLFIILAGFIWDRVNVRRMGYAGLSAYLFSGIIAQIAKNIWDRPRPLLTLYDVRVVYEYLFTHSFPSGHSTTAFAAAFAWSVFLPRGKWVLFVLAFATAFSRVYLGVHFPLDTIYGAIIGTIIGIGCARWFRPIRSGSAHARGRWFSGITNEV